MKKLTLLPLLLLFFLDMQAQEEKINETPLNLYKSITASYAYGVQIYNDNMIYNPGYSFQLSVGNRVSKDVSLGFGAGYMSFGEEHFVPIFAEIIGSKTKKKNTRFFKIQGGYSLGWNETINNNDNYDLNGGIYFNAGVGQRIKVNNAYSLMLQLSLCHQFAEMEYSIFGEEQYTETVNYDMLQISVGFLFH